MSFASEKVSLNELQLEALKEILNMGAGQAAASLSSLTGEHFMLNVPHVAVRTIEEMRVWPVQIAEGQAVMLRVGGDLNGFTSILFSLAAARRLIDHAVDVDQLPDDLDALSESALMELGNVVVGSIVGVFANTLELHLDYSAPTFLSAQPEELVRVGAIGKNPQFIVAIVNFKDSTGASEGYFMTVFDVASMLVVLPAIDGYLKRHGLL